MIKKMLLLFSLFTNLQWKKCLQHTLKSTLLLFYEKEEFHYCCTNKSSALLHCTTKHENITYFCSNCRKISANRVLYEKHKWKCKIETCEVAPRKTSILTFEKYKKKLPCALNIYADIEAILKLSETKDLLQNSS